MKRKLARLSGRLIMYASIAITVVLMLWVFGARPIIKIIEICNTMGGADKFWGIFWQAVKMLFGLSYSFIGMIIFYRIGLKITIKYK